MSAIKYKNPVYPDYFADPYVWRRENEFFAIGTGQREADGKLALDARIFPLLSSTDLIHWESRGRALTPIDAALGDTYWAPEVVYSQSKWWLYYSVGHADRLHHLRVAASDAPEGPYEDIAALTDPEECSFAIDPHAFRDDDGRWYLFHARDFLEESDERGETVRVGTALVVHELIDMTTLAQKGHTVARARYDWQRFAASRPMYNRVYDWHTLEGPCVVKHEGRYYCFYSGGCWQTDTYGVDYVVADNVLGPYFEEGGSTLPRILRTVPGQVIGPGHCSIVLGPDERTHFVVYHAWGMDKTARRMCIDPLAFTSTGPQCSGPTWTEQLLRLARPENVRAYHA
jgi:beta-xylosidase